jgi:hypothetical protein
VELIFIPVGDCPSKNSFHEPLPQGICAGTAFVP